MLRRSVAGLFPSILTLPPPSCSADLTETTRALSKSLTTDLKSLTALKLTRPAQRVALNKLRSDLESALKGFARAQQAGANRTRDALDGARNSTRKEEERRRRENEA